jgi:hypothetical protein
MDNNYLEFLTSPKLSWRSRLELGVAILFTLLIAGFLIVSLSGIPLELIQSRPGTSPAPDAAHLLTPAAPALSLINSTTAQGNVSRFPLGLYAVPPEELPSVRAAGFDFVHIYDSQQSLSNAIRYLTLAEEAGLQVMQNMPVGHLHDGDEFWIDWVSTLAAHDNLMWWYMPEEPGADDQAAMRRLYQIVRQYDPKGRPAALYLGTTHVEGRCDMSDILVVPAYPEYHEAPRVDVWYWIDTARQACPDKAVISVPALFDANFDGTGDRPTPAEARTDVYTAIIGGSPALAWYSYSRGKDLPDLWPAVQEIAKEIKGLTPMLTAPPVAQTIQARVLSGPTYSPSVEGYRSGAIQISQKNHAGTTYILAVNLAEESLAVQFEGLPENAVQVNLLFEERTLPVMDQAFRDEFSASAVHIYKVITQ